MKDRFWKLKWRMSDLEVDQGNDGKITQICSGRVPENTIILSNIDSVLTDPGQWETPEEFNPNHFLDKDGNVVSRGAFLPFSTVSEDAVGSQMTSFWTSPVPNLWKPFAAELQS
ncbi:hypothetical protein Y1Q_0002202 [Alligator mississippiensis]|uniref:Uncharacterized protein n=1 Tax=Alligator mississippiensis TaxID=8496 RepID=A0A151PE23_ALLMI|nr:hypothetical protein Y1Q_0002202 [Alligator mississippiensis]